MAALRVIVVGAGPAGVRAAERLVEAGLRPIVLDEGATAGGQIYRRPPKAHKRSFRTLYGFDARRAERLHTTFRGLLDKIDYRPETLAWALRENVLHVASATRTETIAFDALILATGATDRLLPIPGWTKPGCYSLGGAQIALKAQGCAIGARVTFVGTGPLLYLVSYQYAKAGVDVAAVLDTSPFVAQIKALPKLLTRPAFLLRGLYFRAVLAARGIEVRNGVTPQTIVGDDEVAAVRWRDARGHDHVTPADAVAMGFHLRSETQLADLAGCDFAFDTLTGSWRPEVDRDGRTSRKDIYLAGDGIRVLGADAAETAGRLAAVAVLKDRGHAVDTREISRLRAVMARMERFRAGLTTAFPWPAHLARGVADDTLLCRCEAITAGELRQAALGKGAPELNRAKALSRIGMGRCQGRLCGTAAAEILAEATGSSVEAAGRLRGQAPVKPLPFGRALSEQG